MVFTQEEFDIMVDELLGPNPTTYDMLCHISLKFLGPKVHHWCKTNGALRGRGLEDDILQDICLHLITVTVDKFFLKKNDLGEYAYPRDPATFGMWLKTVAMHKMLDYAKEVGGESNVTMQLREELFPGLAGIEFTDGSGADALLQEAFSIVLSSNAGVHKILTWLAQSVIVLNYNMTRIKARDKMLELFPKMTLADMYSVILLAASRITWLEITDEQHERIFMLLKKPWNEDLRYGEVSYESFFMRYKGEISPKKSISDWINRMDDEILRKLSGNTI